MDISVLYTCLASIETAETVRLPLHLCLLSAVNGCRFCRGAACARTCKYKINNKFKILAKIEDIFNCRKAGARYQVSLYKRMEEFVGIRIHFGADINIFYGVLDYYRGSLWHR